jgi:L-lactate dehydrogenase complex protein LldF
MADPELRRRVKEARMNTFAHLDIVLAELAKNVRARGGQVHFAASAQDAIEYTLTVAKKNAVKRVVKGKSMTSMEINIDPVTAGGGHRSC